MFQDPGTLFQDPGTLCEDPGTLFHDPVTLFQDPGTLFQDPGTILGRAASRLKHFIGTSELPRLKDISSRRPVACNLFQRS